jgi:HlyD family secretion protein
MKTRRALILSVLLIGLSVLSVMVWRSLGDRGQTPPPATAVAALRDLRATVTATGTIRTQVGAEVRVGARISGRVEHLAVQVGGRVAAGQVIAVLQHDDLQAAVDKARADLAAAESRAAQTAVDLRLLREGVGEAITRQSAQLSSARARLQLIVGGARPEELAQAASAVKQAEATHLLAKTTADRTRRLYDDGLLARRDFDTALKDVDIAAAQLETAQQQLRLVERRYRPEDVQIARDDVRQAEVALTLARVDAGRVASKERELSAAHQAARAALATLQIAQTNLSYATITAPLAGVVASVSTQQGETVTAGSASSQAPTFVTIVDLRRLEAHAYVDETDIGKVQVGQTVSFTVDAFPDREFTGKVTAIYPKALVQVNVITYDVAIAIDNAQAVLRPDMTATVTITLAAREQVLSVPNQAVRREDGQRVVYRKQGDRFVPAAVKVGWRDKTYTEILGGLREGDHVLVGEPGSAAISPSSATPNQK